MYSIELQQNVFAAVVEVTESSGEAYIALIVASVAQQTDFYYQQGKGLKDLKSRVRYVLKRLAEQGYLSEHQGKRCDNGIPMLYYKSTKKYIMFDSGFSGMAMNQIFTLLGGPIGIANKVFGMLINNQDKIAAFAAQRQNQLIDEGKIAPNSAIKISFALTPVKDKIRVMELAFSADGKDLKADILKNYSLEEFADMIKKIIELKTKENGGSNNGCIEPRNDGSNNG
ncbi:hypothetical protein [Aureispira anguillae]|uniref:Uncharacterized protein n=1 Tax=Aureispira anguillae TaxID=2864201 RepID=A0A915YBN5_9BACT|nr:hypothetical protein [Aureispira anguillae]BDS10113.1 hypothetical protein AsAng_0008200 [Aureispira anguillae]